MNPQVRFEFLCDIDRSFFVPVSGGDYCRSCKKLVHDFTHLSDEELIVFLRDNAGKGLCGSFRHNQVEQRHLFVKQVSKATKAAAAALLAVFGANEISAQQTVQHPETQMAPAADSVMHKICGTVTYRRGTPLSGVSVSVSMPNGDELGNAASNADGKFEFEFKAPAGTDEFSVTSRKFCNPTKFKITWKASSAKPVHVKYRKPSRWYINRNCWRGKF